MAPPGAPASPGTAGPPPPKRPSAQQARCRSSSARSSSCSYADSLVQRDVWEQSLPHIASCLEDALAPELRLAFTNDLGQPVVVALANIQDVFSGKFL